MSNSNGPKRRTDLLEPEFKPHDQVLKLGEDASHGPDLENHIVLVLGVGPGLGLAIAQTFAARGYTTAILSRTKSRLDGWAQELHTTALQYRQAHKLRLPRDDEVLSAAFACDVLDNEAIKKAIRQVTDFWPDKKLGTACYNASVRKRGPFLEQRMEQVQDGVQASIFAGFVFMQSVIGEMHKHGQGGSVLVTGATSSTRGREGFAGFAASSEFHSSLCTA